MMSFWLISVGPYNSSSFNSLIISLVGKVSFFFLTESSKTHGRRYESIKLTCNIFLLEKGLQAWILTSYT